MKRLKRAAKMAGDWWADLIDDEYAEHRPALAAAVAEMVVLELKGECHWDWWGERIKGPGREGCSFIEFDYDPHGLLIPALAKAMPDVPPSKFKWAFPTKHTLEVYVDRMEPKAGYGNWQDPIPVPDREPAKQPKKT